MSALSTFLQGFHIRPTAMDDLKAVLELVNACYKVDYDEHWSVTESFLRNTWQI